MQKYFILIARKLLPCSQRYDGDEVTSQTETQSAEIERQEHLNRDSELLSHELSR